MSHLGASYTSEVVQVGGIEGIRSLKFSAQAYARVSLATGGKPGMSRSSWNYVDRAEFRKQVSWFVDKAITRRLASVPKDLDTTDRIARAKGVLVPHVERALEKWEIDPTRGVRELIESLLDTHGEELLGQAARHDNDEAHKGSGDSTAASSPAGQGVGELHAGPRGRSADADGAAPEVEDVAEAILPVGRMIVVCCHPGLRKVYTFDFVDNASDYARASETFNKVLNSVRFLV